MSVLCPNPHCNYTGPLASFKLSELVEDLYHCQKCGNGIGVEPGKPAPTCCGQTAVLIRNRSIDVARCPKCLEKSVATAQLGGWATLYVQPSG